MKSSRKLTVAALIAAALILDVVAVLAVPSAGRALRSNSASVLWKAAHVALSTTASAAKQGLATLAGDGLVAAAKGTTKLYGALHRLAPSTARTQTSCKVVVCGTSGIPAVRIAVVPCRKEAVIVRQPTGPARLFSQTL